MRSFIELSYGLRQGRGTPSGLRRGRPSRVQRHLRLVHTTRPQGNARTQDRFCQDCFSIGAKTTILPTSAAGVLPDGPVPVELVLTIFARASGRKRDLVQTVGPVRVEPLRLRERPG